MERFHVSGIPPPTKNADFAALVDPFGEGTLVPSKLDPNECRGFGYISINRKKRSEVLKLLRERFGAEVMLQKPKQDPRDVKTHEVEATPAPVTLAKQHDVSKRKSRLTLNTSKKLRVFDSDDENDTSSSIQQHNSPRSKKEKGAHSDAVRDAAKEVIGSARQAAVSAHVDDSTRPKRRKKEHDPFQQETPLSSSVAHQENPRSMGQQATSSSGEDSSIEDVVHRASRSTKKTSEQEATRNGAKEQRHAGKKEKKDKKKGKEKHEETKDEETKDEETKDEETKDEETRDEEADDKIEAVDNAEVQRQKDMLFSMFPSMVPRKQQPSGRQSSLVVSRFDPAYLPQKKSKTAAAEEPAKRRKVEPTPSSASASAKTSVQAPGPTKTVVNPLFKDVFKTKESTETTNGGAGVSWLNSVLGKSETPSAPTPGVPDVVTSTVPEPSPANWIDSVIRVAEPEKETKPIVQVKISELPPFWRRGSEQEILDAWSKNRAWYVWDLKSKHRSVARAKKVE